VHAKRIDFQKKTCSPTGFEPECHPLNHMAMVFDGMLLEISPLLCLQSTAEHNLITALARGDKLEVGG